MLCDKCAFCLKRKVHEKATDLIMDQHLCLHMHEYLYEGYEILECNNFSQAIKESKISPHKVEWPEAHQELLSQLVDNINT